MGTAGHKGRHGARSGGGQRAWGPCRWVQLGVGAEELPPCASLSRDGVGDGDGAGGASQPREQPDLGREASSGRCAPQAGPLLTGGVQLLAGQGTELPGRLCYLLPCLDLLVRWAPTPREVPGELPPPRFSVCPEPICAPHVHRQD